MKLPFQVCILASLILILTPFFADMPALGLDSSWRFGINQAAAQGLIFGRQVVFSYGPYASIFTRSYHPGTDSLMIWGALYLSFSFWLAVYRLTEDRTQRRITAVAMVLGLSVASPDSRFLFYPLLAGLFCIKPTESSRVIRLAKMPSWVWVSVLFFPFGLLSLIKGSMLFFGIAVVAVSTGFLWVNRRFYDAVAVMASPLVGISFFWLVAGQSMVDLPHFFYSNVLIAQGYSEAMGIESQAPEARPETATVSTSSNSQRTRRNVRRFRAGLGAAS